MQFASYFTNIRVLRLHNRFYGLGCCPVRSLVLAQMRFINKCTTFEHKFYVYPGFSKYVLEKVLDVLGKYYRSSTVQVQVQYLKISSSTSTFQVLQKMYLSTSTKYKYCTCLPVCCTLCTLVHYRY